jgi:hypothetical protein
MGIAEMGVALTIPTPQSSSWSILALLLLLTLSYQILVPKVTGHPAEDAYLFFFAAGILLLPPSFFVLLVLLSYLSRWGKHWWTDQQLPRKWFPQLVLLAAHMMAGVAAHAIQVLLPAWPALSLPLRSMIPAGLAILTYVVGYRLFLGRTGIGLDAKLSLASV